VLRQVKEVAPAATVTFTPLFAGGDRAPTDLTVTYRDQCVVLDFPCQPVRALADEGLAAAVRRALQLDTAPRWLGETASVPRSTAKVVVVLDSAEEVARLQPDFSAFRDVPHGGIVCTAPAARGPAGVAGTADADFVSRYFAPRIGVNEDAVTGSAHCALAPFWQQRLGAAAGARLRGVQLSARGGAMDCRVCGERVELSGSAVLFSQGTLLLPQSLDGGAC
jgi:PhzF family phenazine biosynthesis protein